MKTMEAVETIVRGTADGALVFLVWSNYQEGDLRDLALLAPLLLVAAIDLARTCRTLVRG